LYPAGTPPCCRPRPSRCSARLAANPAQLPTDQTAGPFTQSIPPTLGTFGPQWVRSRFGGTQHGQQNQRPDQGG
jgi:hypothetical protein